VFVNEGTTKDLTGSKKKWGTAFEELQKSLNKEHKEQKNFKEVERVVLIFENKKTSDGEALEYLIEMIIISFKNKIKFEILPSTSAEYKYLLRERLPGIQEKYGDRITYEFTRF